jgi:HEPN domain-containing protein
MVTANGIVLLPTRRLRWLDNPFSLSRAWMPGGHTLTVLIGNLPGAIEQSLETLVDFARVLDKYYIPTHYPNGFDSGAPTDFYTREEAQSAIGQAETIHEFCRDKIN